MQILNGFGLCQLLAALMKNQVAILGGFVFCFTFLYMFSGALFNIQTAAPLLKSWMSISPFFAAFESLAVNEFHDPGYEQWAVEKLEGLQASVARNRLGPSLLDILQGQTNA